MCITWRSGLTAGLIIILFFVISPKHLLAAEITGEIHKDFTANTDACGNCHTFHNGAGTDLLKWNTYSNGVVNLTSVCMACHDGTETNTYNVKNGTYVGSDDAKTYDNNGGLFALDNDPNAPSGSQHAVFSNVIDSAAFGGANVSQSDANGRWTAVLDCTSCHTPHGQGGNYRLLEPNPNWVQTGGQDPSTTPGKRGVFIAIADGSSTSYTWPNSDKPILGQPYDTSNQVYEDGKPTLDGKITWDGTQIKVTFTAPPTTNCTITADYTPVLVVSGTVTNMLTSGETASYTSGINKFCGACHTDYDTENISVNPAMGQPNGSGSELSGIYGTQHTRHQVGMIWSQRKTAESRGLRFAGSDPNNGIVTCLTCHYAHGVDEARWAETANKTGISADNTVELAGSSRLKVLPNMGVCEACHDKESANYSASPSF